MEVCSKGDGQGEVHLLGIIKKTITHRGWNEGVTSQGKLTDRGAIQGRWAERGAIEQDQLRGDAIPGG